MPKWIRLLFGLVLVAGLALPGGPGRAQPASPAEPEITRLIVRMRSPDGAGTFSEPAALSPADLTTLSAAAGVDLTYDRPMALGMQVVALPGPLPLSAARAIAARLSADPSVAFAEPDEPVSELLAPINDTYFPNQWDLTLPSAGSYGVNASAAWALTTGSSAVRIAVLDTGALPLHPDLAGRFTGGYDMISYATAADSPSTDLSAGGSHDGTGRDADPSDAGSWGCGNPSSWHGSHVSGTIGAITNNAAGIAGLNWTSPIVPVRVLGACGSGSSSDIIDAITWASGGTVPFVAANPNPARVLNLSLGGYASDQACPAAYQTAIDAAVARGAIVVVAAGNSSIDASYARPGNCNNVITVAATNRSGGLATYSNYGPLVEIAAPGGEAGTNNGILSTVNGGSTAPIADYGYSEYRGTSMSAPHISAIVSLMLSVDPDLTTQTATWILRHTATVVPCAGAATMSCGAGIANAGAAVQHALDLYRIKSPSTYAPVYAGLPAAPRSIKVRTYYAQAGLKAADFTVLINGLPAAVTAAVAGGTGYYDLTVTPPVQAAGGAYPLQLLILGSAVASHEKAVLYGPSTYLPSVSR